ncbi:trypsin 3A1-like [Musca autumnalis]|uniref:trypsin 3A1-like n=1 Tax=Musca autumnalis TaxID=221902 RepID=UPI003CF5D941
MALQELLLALILCIVGYRQSVAQPLTETSSPSVFGAAEDFNYDGRIVGGEVTSILSYPFQVSLQHLKSHICGGSILSQNIILTAAHCIENPKDVKEYRIRAGSNSHSYGGQVIGVRQIIIHEAYNHKDLNCDLALVLLSSNLKFSSRIQTIALPRHGAKVPNNEELFVSGWGLTSETGAVAPLLNHVAVRLMSQRVCEESYRYVAHITEQMFCAGLPEGGKDSCQGDSGGPLVGYVTAATSSVATTSKQLPTPKPIQYGIVSFWCGLCPKGISWCLRQCFRSTTMDRCKDKRNDKS